MTGHRGWEGQGGGYRPSQPAARVLRAAGFTINNDLRGEGLRVRTFGTDKVSIVLDFDIAHDDLPERLLDVLAALRDKGYQVEHVSADATSARAVVYRAPLKHRSKKVTRSGDGSGVDVPPLRG